MNIRFITPRLPSFQAPSPAVSAGAMRPVHFTLHLIILLVLAKFIVPGVNENRPSLVLGDRLYLRPVFPRQPVQFEFEAAVRSPYQTSMLTFVILLPLPWQSMFLGEQEPTTAGRQSELT